MYEALRQEQQKAAAICREGGLAVARFTFSWDDDGCRKCGSPEAEKFFRHATESLWPWNAKVMLAATPLVLNLRNASYCETVYGGAEPQTLAERFSLVDSRVPAQLLKSWCREKLLVRLPRKYESLKDLPHKLVRFIDVAYTKLQK